jgi:hypothetical protein
MLRDWTEPAHPGILRFHDELISVYRDMRAVQERIDQAFDDVARQIGYVVTTTIPVRIDVDAKGKVSNPRLDSEPLKTSEFAKFAELVANLNGKVFRGVPAGSYRFYLIWYDALRLKLRRDWMEPAHVVRGFLERILPAAQKKSALDLKYEPHEPAHWFDPGVMIEIEDLVVISAIDEVYPELRLSERIAADRIAIAKIRPEVMEPVHYRDLLQNRDILAELRALLARSR